MAGKLAPDSFAFFTFQVAWQIDEGIVQQSEQGSKGLFVAAVGRCRDEEQMLVRLLGDFFKEIIALLSAPSRTAGDGAAVSFIYDNKFGAFQYEVVRPSVRFNEIDGYDEKGVTVEDGHANGQISFEPLNGAAEHKFGVNMKLFRQLFLPLFR